MFKNTQDSAHLELVLEACASEEFWCWMHCAFRFGIRPLEKARRWGLMCLCHAAAYARGESPKCDRSSRLLGHAREKAKELQRSFRETIRVISLEQCEKYVTMLRWTSFSLCCPINECGERFSHLDLVTWLFSEVTKAAQSQRNRSPNGQQRIRRT